LDDGGGADFNEAPCAGAAPAGYQGMLTSPDILTTNARDLKVENFSFQLLLKRRGQ
jgi:hypothetical protein